METTTFLIILFVICCIWYWVPEIINTYHYYKYKIKIINNFKYFIKYLKFKLKNNEIKR